MKNIYIRRPYSLLQEETAFHLRNPETGIIRGAEPFFFEGRGEEAVLCIHGFTSSPRDLKGLGKILNSGGLTVCGIRLPGHGTRPTDIDQLSWEDWVESADSAFLKLSQKFKKVHLVGFSMGGALALHLALRRTAAKLVLLSPFFKIAYQPAHVLPEEWLVFSVGRLLRHLKKTFSGNCNDLGERKRHIAYFHFSLHAIKQALALVKEVKKGVSQIENPVLFIHSKGDRTTSPRATRRFFESLATREKRFVWLKKSNHIITRDFERLRVFEEVANFLVPEKQI